MSGADPTEPDPCAACGCDARAAFRFYDREDGAWRPRCERHALEIHPSLELGALLESGYLRPIEVDPPDGPPTEPANARAAAFREEVEALLGWSG